MTYTEALNYIMSHRKFQKTNSHERIEALLSLFDNPHKRAEMGKAAYQTMMNKWSPDIAGERLLRLLNDLQKSGECDTFENGPCSRAEVLENEWYGG